MKRLILVLALSAAASPALAQAVPGYGGFTPLPRAGEQPVPSRLYKVIFNLSQGAENDAPLRGLDRAARLLNMLEAGGVTADRRQIVIVAHGGATQALLSDEAWSARGLGPANPSSGLLSALMQAGVSIRVCAQAMTRMNIAPTDLIEGVAVDLAALTTLIHHQQDGFAVVGD